MQHYIVRKEILPKNGLIEEMKTAWDNKEVPQTFFHNFPCLLT